ncbi:MAG TPA: alpha-ketoglutarate-dependent dioxygenase AlkB [Mycobacteriales bacterium]|nr:alpha-ketoglutarate-dependent dioxygenase AlkB [Mycobacteriales bacterium]
MDLAWQESLFGTAPRPRLAFDGLRHEPLDARAWIDVVEGWVPDHAELFARLKEEAPWAQRTRKMWENEVLVPRLVAAYRDVAELPPYLEELRAALSDRYDVDIDSCLVNLYRHGDDAVAWHGDTVRKIMPHPLVFTVSLGARRRFVLRHGSTGPVVRSYVPGEGDLIVMGGRTQHEWQHAVPRDKRVSGARMSVTFRHSRPGGERYAAQVASGREEPVTSG